MPRICAPETDIEPVISNVFRVDPLVIGGIATDAWSHVLYQYPQRGQFFAHMQPVSRARLIGVQFCDTVVDNFDSNFFVSGVPVDHPDAVIELVTGSWVERDYTRLRILNE